MTIDIDAVRSDTPGAELVLHFNNAGSALMPQGVLDAQISFLTREAEIGGYEAAAEAGEALDNTYTSIARLIGAGRSEIALLESATRAWQSAFLAIDWREGDRILTAEAEYASNYLAFLQLQERLGIEIVAVPSDGEGQTDVSALERLVDDRTRLIAITHVPTNGGLVNPAEEIGRVARANGILYLLDACQSVGQMDLSVDALGCDFLSATGRKYLRGPRGTGFLYVRQDVLEQLSPPFLDMLGADLVATDRYEMRADATRFENFESHVAGRVGLGVAVDYALDLGMPAIESRVTGLADSLRDALSDLAGVTVTDIGARKCGIVTFNHEGLAPSEIKARLQAERINVTTSQWTSTLIDMQKRGLTQVVRASMHYYNTEEEIDRFCGALRALG